MLEVLEKSGPTLAAQIDRLPTQLSGDGPRVDWPPLGRWGGGCVVSFAAVIAYRAVSLGSCLAWTSAVLAGAVQVVLIDGWALLADASEIARKHEA